MALRFGKLPKHVAIIMDGNRRWARQHHLPPVAGHKRVVETGVEELIEHAAALKIPYLTFWAFSTENWGRNPLEVRGIMECFRWALKHQAQKLLQKGARVRMIGDLSKFDQDIQNEFQTLIEKTKDNSKITTIFALNYGGRDEIIRAMRRIWDSGSGISNITKEDFNTYIDTAGVPDPDLIIRTGGEQRLSGFMLWQSEYSELYFTDTYMPDFNAAALDVALKEYALRERRKGK